MDILSEYPSSLSVGTMKSSLVLVRDIVGIGMSAIPSVSLWKVSVELELVKFSASSSVLISNDCSEARLNVFDFRSISFLSIAWFYRLEKFTILVVSRVIRLYEGIMHVAICALSLSWRWPCTCWVWRMYICRVDKSSKLFFHLSFPECFSIEGDPWNRGVAYSPKD